MTFPPARKEEREAGVIHGTPWVPRVTGGPVCTYTEPRICGPWHGAQLGGPIPLTRSQHPSLAIIPLGGSLTKDLIKYCYTRILIPLRTLLLQSPTGEIRKPECAALSCHSLDPRENFRPPSKPPPLSSSRTYFSVSSSSSSIVCNASKDRCRTSVRISLRVCSL